MARWLLVVLMTAMVVSNSLASPPEGADAFIQPADVSEYADLKDESAAAPVDVMVEPLVKIGKGIITEAAKPRRHPYGNDVMDARTDRFYRQKGRPIAPWREDREDQQPTRLAFPTTLHGCQPSGRGTDDHLTADALQRVRVASHDALKIIMSQPRSSSNNWLFVLMRVDTFDTRRQDTVDIAKFLISNRDSGIDFENFEQAMVDRPLWSQSRTGHVLAENSDKASETDVQRRTVNDLAQDRMAVMMATTSNYGRKVPPPAPALSLTFAPKWLRLEPWMVQGRTGGVTGPGQAATGRPGGGIGPGQAAAGGRGGAGRSGPGQAAAGGRGGAGSGPGQAAAGGRGGAWSGRGQAAAGRGRRANGRVAHIQTPPLGDWFCSPECPNDGSYVYCLCQDRKSSTGSA
uniref:Thyroglobulin type-1 domain-containing protein n=1 Tax=Branchiostoma floridae TaxID=7739 RepID=C3YKK4_BRAFL|eukprot:XP_002603060.1 hypothetical protein BRAFLDRAFT_63306 [Branchiostoma floridae]